MSRGRRTWWLGIVAFVALGTSGERSFDLQGHRGARGLQWVARPKPLLRELSWEQLVRFDVGRLRPGSAYAGRIPAQRGRDGNRVPRLGDVLEAAERRTGGEIPGCAVWSPDYRHLVASELALGHRLGLRVVHGTVSERIDIDAMLFLVVDGLVSERPDRFREALAAGSLPLPRAYAPAASTPGGRPRQQRVVRAEACWAA